MACGATGLAGCSRSACTRGYAASCNSSGTGSSTATHPPALPSHPALPPCRYPQTGASILLPLHYSDNYQRMVLMKAGGSAVEKANKETPASNQAHFIEVSRGEALATPCSWQLMPVVAYRLRIKRMFTPLPLPAPLSAAERGQGCAVARRPDAPEPRHARRRAPVRRHHPSRQRRDPGRGGECRAQGARLRAF